MTRNRKIKIRKPLDRSKLPNAGAFDSHVPSNRDWSLIIFPLAAWNMSTGEAVSAGRRSARRSSFPFLFLQLTHHNTTTCSPLQLTDHHGCHANFCGLWRSSRGGLPGARYVISACFAKPVKVCSLKLLAFLTLRAALGYGVELYGAGTPNAVSVFKIWTPSYLFTRDDVRYRRHFLNTPPHALLCG